METILFYINAINGGGAERVIIQLAGHFAEEGYKAILVTSFIDEKYEYPVPDSVIRLSLEQQEIKQSRIKRNITRISKLRAICRKEKPAAVIAFMAEPSSRALIATRGLKTKTIVSVRNDPKKEYAGISGYLIGKLLLPQADGCVFQTEEAKSWFPIKLQKKSEVIFNDVKEEFFSISRINQKDLISVGRLSPQKNHMLLIRAFAQIADRHPNQNLLIYGTGILEGKLKDLIHTLGMEERIKLLGQTDHVEDVLAGAKVFALSSDCEGMPNSLMEALAAGVPCISTDCPCGGPRALISNRVNGILVPVGDEKAMSEAIDLMFSDIEFAEKLGKKAKETAQKFHPNAVFKEWLYYVRRIIAH